MKLFNLKKIVITIFVSFGLILSSSFVLLAQNNSKYPSVNKLEGCWYVGLDHHYYINVSNDTISVAEGFLMDAGPVNYYKLLSGNKFEYLGFYSWEIDGLINNQNDGASFTTFDVQSENGVKFLVKNGERVAKDTATINNYLVAGYYKGKTKEYFIDPLNKNCSAFASKSFTVKMLGDNAYFDDEECSDIILSFGNINFNVNTKRLSYNDSDKVIDELKRIYRDNTKERYPFTATDELDVYFLERAFSLEELKIMRNEIFARHGYIFSTDAMKKHFSSQTWYKGTKNNVDNLLNPIEKKNISTIKEAENFLKNK